MPKFFCDYCDVYLTHDSMSVRKAHNSGRNHLRNVVDYYQQIGHEKAQSVIDSITSSYAAEGQSSSNPMLHNPAAATPFPPFPPANFPGGIPPPFPPSSGPGGMPFPPPGGRGFPMPPLPGQPGAPPMPGLPGFPGMPAGMPFPPPGGLPPNFQFPIPPPGGFGAIPPPSGAQFPGIPAPPRGNDERR